MRKTDKKNTIHSGRTIGEKREHLETSSERIAIHKKSQKKQRFRLIITSIFFLGCIIFTIFVVFFLLNKREERENYSATLVMPFTPTIEVIDENADAVNGKISESMKEYIGKAESDFRELGYNPVKVIIPSGAIREVDFYLEGFNGFIKLITDRGTGVSVEDADRMIRYLKGIDVSDFNYIDVRIEGKAYWK